MEDVLPSERPPASKRFDPPRWTSGRTVRPKRYSPRTMGSVEFSPALRWSDSIRSLEGAVPSTNWPMFVTRVCDLHCGLRPKAKERKRVCKGKKVEHQINEQNASLVLIFTNVIQLSFRPSQSDRILSGSGLSHSEGKPPVPSESDLLGVGSIGATAVVARFQARLRAATGVGYATEKDRARCMGQFGWVTRCGARRRSAHNALCLLEPQSGGSACEQLQPLRAGCPGACPHAWWLCSWLSSLGGVCGHRQMFRNRNYEERPLN